MEDSTSFNKKIFELLKLKQNSTGLSKKPIRMPSIIDISKMLTNLGIENYTEDSSHTVTFRSRGRKYSNNRYEGKKGKKLTIVETPIVLDSSESYYSINNWIYAREIIDLIQSKNIEL